MTDRNVWLKVETVFELEPGTTCTPLVPPRPKRHAPGAPPPGFSGPAMSPFGWRWGGTAGRFRDPGRFRCGRVH